MESKSDAELVQEFYPTLESDYSQIKNSTWQEENKEALGLVDTGLKILAAVALTAGTVMTGGAGLPLALAGGAYLFADGAHSAITGNTLITGTQLSTEERIWAGAEAVVTLATLGSFAAGQGALRAGKQIPTTVQTIGKLAGYADEGVELGQLASGILSGDGTNATLNYIGGKAFEGIVEGSVKGLQSQLSHIEVSSPSQIQLNARQGQDFVDLQTVEFGKIASKVENNITIKMTVDGVEQKIRVDAIGFDEAGNIRIQEYTTAQNGLKISRQNLLEDLSKYGGTIVGAGKGDFVGGVEIPKGTRIDVVSQKTGIETLKVASVADELTVMDMVSKYDDIYAYEFNGTTNPGPLAELSSRPNRNFYGGRYNTIELDDDIVLYRAGRGDNPMGQWFTTEPPFSRAQVRIDTAVKDIWTTPDGVYTGQSPIDKVYKIKIPKGTTIYDGPVASQGGIYQGGLDKIQIFIDSPWNIEGVEVLDSWYINP
ncbi:TPA: hypothetical protein ACGO5E_000042 [Streptococcus suis]